MNNVHEPGSRTMSKKNLTQENTESNRAKNRPSAPSAQPKASPRAQAAQAPPCARAPAARALAALRAFRLRAYHLARLPSARPALCQRSCCAPSARPNLLMFKHKLFDSNYLTKHIISRKCIFVSLFLGTVKP